MKNSYPIILTPDDPGYVVYIPDFDINTQGENLTEAIEMARDAIGLMGIDLEDDKKPIPDPTPLDAISVKADEILSLVDVNFAEYRRKHEMRAVRKNVTIPSWLNEAAEEADINFSAILQSALKSALKITEPRV